MYKNILYACSTLYLNILLWQKQFMFIGTSEIFALCLWKNIITQDNILKTQKSGWIYLYN